MRTLVTLALGASLSLGVAAPATATTTEATPFPVCQNIYINRNWFGAVCADPGNRDCFVYGGGYVWNMCVVNPL